MRRPIITILSLIIISVFIRLFFGVYIDEEFGEEHIFIKHRVTWKWNFYSPIGMSDMKIEDLSKEKQFEENNFDEFVRQRIKQ